MSFLIPKIEITFEEIRVEKFFPGDNLQPPDGPIFEFVNVKYYGIDLELYPEPFQDFINEQLQKYSETLDYREYLVN